MIQSAYDILVHVLEWANSSSDTRAVSMAKRAVQEARRLVANAKNWGYYNTPGRIVTAASYSTGTVAYDYTGGAYERMLTLTDGTWPTDAAYGAVYIDGYCYPIDERKSSTVVTLQEDHAPTGDIAASTSYEWFRDTYVLPADCRAIGNIVEQNYLDKPTLVTWQELHDKRAATYSSGMPSSYAFGFDPDYPGRIAIRFWQAPDAAYKYDFAYQRRPPAIQTFDYSDGTVSMTSGSAVVTGSGTAFTPAMEGAVFRIGTTSDKPTDFSGLYPFVFQSRIRSVDSSTQVTLYDVADANYSAKKYRISDWWDFEDGAMNQAVMRCAEWQYGVMMNRQDANEAEARYQRAMYQAKEADARSYATDQVVMSIDPAKWPYSLTGV